LFFFGTLDGTIGYIAPISEAVYRRLSMLHTKMVINLSHYGGLNPQAWRAFVPQTKATYKNKKNILDGELLTRLVSF